MLPSWIWLAANTADPAPPKTSHRVPSISQSSRAIMLGSWTVGMGPVLTSVDMGAAFRAFG